MLSRPVTGGKNPGLKTAIARRPYVISKRLRASSNARGTHQNLQWTKGSVRSIYVLMMIHYR